MNEIRPVFSSRIQFFGKSKERFGIVMEKVYVKDGFWVGDSVLLEVVIETSTRRPRIEREKWSSSSHRIDHSVLVQIHTYYS